MSANTLATDYAEKLKRMQERLDREISKNVVVPDGVKVPRKTGPKIEDTAEEKLLKEINAKNKASNEGIDLDLIPEKEEEKPVDKYSYTRSQRAVEMRVTDNLTMGTIEAKSGSRTNKLSH